MSQPKVSIIICTRSRAEHLRATLESFRRLHIPGDLPCELLVIDNGSTDETPQVVQEFHLPQMPVRYVREDRKGQCFARNTGVALAQGQVIVFTDDDVRPSVDWIEGMCRPILNGEADAVAGSVTLAPHLLRDWMTPTHRAWLASTEGLRADAENIELVGANMAFSRKVLERVPGFDTELGPGALGFVDETLFSRQLARAGYRIIARPAVTVEHHFEPSRLLKSSFLSSARARGQSMAYVEWHWEHHTLRFARLRLLRQLLPLWGRRLLAGRQGPEGAPEWEMNGEQFAQFFRQSLVERRRARNYEKHGLVKITHE